MTTATEITAIERAALKLIDRYARTTNNADAIAYLERIVSDAEYVEFMPQAAQDSVYAARVAAKQADKGDPDYADNLRETRRAHQYCEALRRLSFAVATYRQSGRTTSYAVTRDDNQAVQSTFHESTDLADAVVEFTTQAIEAEFQGY